MSKSSCSKEKLENYRGVASISNFSEKSLPRFQSISIRVWPKSDPPKLARGEYVTMTIIPRQSCSLVSFVFQCLNIYLISFNLTVAGFWFFQLFFWRGRTEKFMALASGSDKKVPMTSSSFGAVYSSLSKASERCNNVWFTMLIDILTLILQGTSRSSSN